MNLQVWAKSSQKNSRVFPGSQIKLFSMKNLKKKCRNFSLVPHDLRKNSRVSRGYLNFAGFPELAATLFQVQINFILFRQEYMYVLCRHMYPEPLPSPSVRQPFYAYVHLCMLYLAMHVNSTRICRTFLCRRAVKL